MLKRFITEGMILTLLLAVAGCGGLSSDDVASVNGKVISKKDMERYIAISNWPQVIDTSSPEYESVKKNFVEVLVGIEIIKSEAKKLNLAVSDDEVNEKYNNLVEQNGGEEKLRDDMQKIDVSTDEVKQVVRDNLVFQKLLTEITKDMPQVSDQEALKYYNDNLTQFQNPEAFHVFHILVKDEATANQLEARIAAGEDFGTLARQFSEDPGSRDAGGDLGIVTKQGVDSKGNTYVPEFVQAMNSLEKGQVSAPVKTSIIPGGGYFIIKVTDSARSFDEVKEEIRQGFFLQSQRTVFDAWFKSAKGNYTIEYTDEFKPKETTTQPAVNGAQTQAQPAQ